MLTPPSPCSDWLQEFLWHEHLQVIGSVCSRWLCGQGVEATFQDLGFGITLSLALRDLSLTENGLVLRGTEHQQAPPAPAGAASAQPLCRSGLERGRNTQVGEKQGVRASSAPSGLFCAGTLPPVELVENKHQAVPFYPAHH